jgi:mannonate dehydratase
MLECLRAYRDIGFAGILRSDHVPTVEGDHAAVAGYSHQARLHAIGYLRGLCEAVEREAAAAQPAAGARPSGVTS